MRERLDQVDSGSPSSACSRPCNAVRGWWASPGTTTCSVDGTGYHSSTSVRCCEKRSRHHYVFAGCGAGASGTPGGVSAGAGADSARRWGKEKRLRAQRCEAAAAGRAAGASPSEAAGGGGCVGSNGPHIELLRSLDMRFVLGVKPGDHKHLFQWVDTTPGTRTVETVDAGGVSRRYRSQRRASERHALRGGEQYRETRPANGSNAFHRLEDHRGKRRGADACRPRPVAHRKRDFQHPEEPRLWLFGHGKQHLATVFAQLTMLAFLIDQVQQRCCPLFRVAREKEGRSKYLWERLRGLFLEFFIPDWETLYRAIAFGHHRTELVPFNTS